MLKYELEVTSISSTVHVCQPDNVGGWRCWLKQVAETIGLLKTLDFANFGGFRGFRFLDPPEPLYLAAVTVATVHLVLRRAVVLYCSCVPACPSVYYVDPSTKLKSHFQLPRTVQRPMPMNLHSSQSRVSDPTYRQATPSGNAGLLNGCNSPTVC